MNSGWIKIHRKITEWEWYQDTNVFRLFIHLLLSVNFENKKWQGIDVKRGEIIVGIEDFGKKIGLTRQQTRSALDKLKSTNEITIKTTNKFTIVTVNKYNEYQEITNNVTNEQPSNNQQITTTKEYKNIRNKENKLYTTENLTLQQVADKILIHFNKVMGTHFTNTKVFINNLEKCLENHEPKQIAQAISQIKNDDFWKVVATPEKIFRQSKEGQPKDYIEDLLSNRNIGNTSDQLISLTSNE